MISTARKVVDIALSFDGCTQNSAEHREIIKTFNKVKPQGYTAHLSDPWCAEAWSAWQIMAGNSMSEVPMSASCSTIISIARNMGILVENENCVPEIGWGIIYDWQDDGKGDNHGDPDHIGIIYKVDSEYIYVIEGNKGANHVCGKRAVKINGQYIRCFIAPKYRKETPKPYDGKFPNYNVKAKKLVSQGDKIIKVADQFCYPKGTPKKKWAYKTGKPKREYKDYAPIKKDITLSDCGYYVRQDYRKGVGINFDPLTESGMPSEHPPKGIRIVHKGKIPKGFLQAGDAIAYKKKSGQHTLFYYGYGLIAEAGRGIRYPVIHSAKVNGVLKWNASSVKKNTIRVYRAYKEVTVTRNHLRKGDKGEAVLKWQKYLNWYFGERVVALDGKFENATDKYTKKFQTQNGIKPTGHVGKNTIAKAKGVKR